MREKRLENKLNGIDLFNGSEKRDFRDETYASLMEYVRVVCHNYSSKILDWITNRSPEEKNISYSSSQNGITVTSSFSIS